MKKNICFFGVLVSLFMVSVASGYQFIFTPRGAVDGEFTDNVNNTKEDKKSDFLVKLSAGFSAEIFTQTSGLEVSYDPVFVSYRNSGIKNDVRQNFTLRGWTKPSKNTHFQVRNVFRVTDDPNEIGGSNTLREEAADPALEPPLAERDDSIRTGRFTRWYNTTLGTFGYQFSERGIVDLGYLYSIYNDDDPTVSDYQRHSPTVGLSYTFSPRYFMRTGIDYTRGVYSDDVDDFEAWEGNIQLNRVFTRHFTGLVRYDHVYRNSFDDLGIDYQLYSPSLGVDYTIAENFYINARIGYFFRDVDKDEDDLGLVLDGEIGKTWEFKRGGIDLIGSSGFDSQDFAAETLGFNRFYLARSRGFYDFSRRLVGDVTALFRRQEFLDDVEDRNNIRAGAGLSYLVFQRLTFRTEYQYRYVDSNLDENDRQENRITFGFSYSYPIQLR